jgi:hypothetical protein
MPFLRPFDDDGTNDEAAAQGLTINPDPVAYFSRG